MTSARTFKHGRLYAALLGVGIIGAILVQKMETDKEAPKKKTLVVTAKKTATAAPATSIAGTAGTNYTAKSLLAFQAEYDAYVADYQAKMKALQEKWYNQLKHATKWGIFGSDSDWKKNLTAEGYPQYTTNINEAIAYDIVNYPQKFGFGAAPTWDPPKYQA